MDLNEGFFKALKLYETAAIKLNPEAITAMALLMHMQLLQVISGKATIEVTDLTAELPDDVLQRLIRIDRSGRIRPPSDRYYEMMWWTMWDYLEKAAELEWCSPFLSKITERAFKTGFYAPTPRLRQLMIKRQSEFAEYFNRIQSKLSNLCNNPLCNLKMLDDKALKVCGICMTAKYCSKECQVAHWHKSHKKECVRQSVATNAAAGFNLINLLFFREF